MLMAKCKCSNMKDGGMSKLKKLFKGKDTHAEELKEARAIKSGKITPEEYAKGEKMEGEGMKCGGKVKKMAAGGKAGQLAKANGIAQRGKSRGKIV